MLDVKKILNSTDHTNLNPCATREDIINLCREALVYETASVCIAQSRIKDAHNFLQKVYTNDLVTSRFKNRYPRICTVIGFPHGNISTKMKMVEAIDAISCGVDEIDMVVNLGWIKEGKFEEILNEINMVKAVCERRILKVIVETCYLTEEEKIKMCKIISASSADYIKTSTGFGTAGATPEDIILFKKYITNGKKIKAAGGMSCLEDGQKFLDLGADRLGSSKMVKDAIARKIG